MVTPVTHEVRGSRPWANLPPGTVDVFRPLQRAIAEEIIATLAREVPAYAKPLEGAFGEGVRMGVEQALEQFARLMEDPNTSRAQGRAVYIALGRTELRSGRSIGALLAAYRVGAQVAWRRLAAAGLEANLPQATMNLLAESIFAYIDELSAESAEGYALEQADMAGQADRRRAELIELMMRDNPLADPKALTAAAEAIGWRMPKTLMVLVWPEQLGHRPATRLPQDSIAAQVDGMFCAIVPDPEGGRRSEIDYTLAKTLVGAGPVVEPSEATRSRRYAIAALQLGQERGADGLVHSDEHRVELICRLDPALTAEIAQDRLSALDDETPNSRDRLRETLLAWLRRDGDVTLAAEDLNVHAQTVRYRLSRLRDLLGDAMDDPDARFEMEFALRAGVV
jgi:hypothetical protein